MSKRRGAFCILLGTALIVSALFLYGYNQWQDSKSGSYAYKVVEQVQEEIRSKNSKEGDSAGKNETKNSDEQNGSETPTILLDGYEYMGYLQIPDLDLELPVMADWDYEKMKISPCRQFGSLQTNDLVIAAHNYDSFFGRLQNLTVGATVRVIDLEGIVNQYQVDHLEVLDPTEVEAVSDSGYDLVLYTCTYGGKTRVTVFCNRI